MNEVVASISGGIFLMAVGYLIWTIKENTKSLRANTTEQVRLEAKVEILSAKIDTVMRTREDVDTLGTKLRQIEKLLQI